MIDAIFLFLEPIGHPLLGYIIPGVILLISFVLTWLLYRRFSRH